MTAETGDRRLYDDDGTPIRKPGHDQPVHASPQAGKRPVTPEGSGDVYAVPTDVGRLLVQIDEEIGGTLGARTPSLRRQLFDTRSAAATERSLKQDALARLAQAETELAAERAERAKDRDRIAELVLTLRALGEKTDPAGHDTQDNESGAVAATKEQQ